MFVVALSDAHTYSRLELFGTFISEMKDKTPIAAPWARADHLQLFALYNQYITFAAPLCTGKH